MDRPAAVPEGAQWLADVERWELKEQSGTRQWRADGALFMRGGDDGPFTVFHPNGQLAREGSLVAGDPDGEIVAYGSDAPTSEMLRGCCVPPGAWQMKALYDRGQLQREIFFDRQGRQLLSDGSPRPDRPAGVPEGAEFDEFGKRWVQQDGVWRYWTVEGRLDEEAELVEGRKVSSRMYGVDGQPIHEARFMGDGVRHGSWMRRFAEGELPYADARIASEEGTFDEGQAVGAWTFRDRAGAPVRTVDLGAGHRDDEAAEVFDNEVRPAEAWMALAHRLRAGRHAICAAARAAAAEGKPDRLRTFLADAVVPLGEEANARVLAELNEASGDSLRASLGALVGGADPAASLRSLASALRAAPRASADLAEAAILLAPERPMAYLTRGLIRIELGDPEAAVADAARVAVESPATAQFLRDYARVIFPSFSFWPGREIPHSPLDNMPDEPAQPLEALRGAIQVYAARLQRIRDAVERTVGGRPVWLPPDLSALGAVELRAYTATITDETETGTEETEVKIDETLALDAWGLPALMRLARAQWTALCWLCWSAGLDEVALPAELRPPANFGQAAGMAISRHWRAQDAVATGGLRALTAGVPGFAWEEMEIDAVPRMFAEMACDEYLEMRSVFLFLASPENLSPFQNDLRQV